MYVEAVEQGYLPRHSAHLVRYSPRLEQWVYGKSWDTPLAYSLQWHATGTAGRTATVYTNFVVLVVAVRWLILTSLI